MNTERNSLQLEARICVVSEAMSTSSPMTSTTSPTARVLALTGYLSKYVQDLELAPGWHRLPNGVVAYSDPVAVRLADPKDNIEKAYKSRLTLVKEKNGQWTQLEKEDDITEAKPHIFRKIGLNDEPHRTLSFFAPAKFRDYWEPDSEVPISPCPEPEDAIKATAWSADDGGEIEEMEQQVEHHDIEKRVIAQHPHEVELDETPFSEKTSVKDLQIACKERNLAYTGSKKRLLKRLTTFKINLETVNCKPHLQGAGETSSDHWTTKVAELSRSGTTLHHPHALRWMVPGLCGKPCERGQAPSTGRAGRSGQECHSDGLLLYVH